MRAGMCTHAPVRHEMARRCAPCPVRFALCLQSIRGRAEAKERELADLAAQRKRENDIRRVEKEFELKKRLDRVDEIGKVSCWAELQGCMVARAAMGGAVVGVRFSALRIDPHVPVCLPPTHAHTHTHTLRMHRTAALPARRPTLHLFLPPSLLPCLPAPPPPPPGPPVPAAQPA